MRRSIWSSSEACVLMRPGDPYAGESAQAAAGSMAVYPGIAAAEQDRPVSAGAYGPVDGAPGGWRQRESARNS
jgi:hypothetical protein